ncbi:MAG TPA: YfhO family protein [Candidatus Binatia bacterium]|nr:YfhO family protein [Candidatus Binatia bacterium]
MTRRKDKSGVYRDFFPLVLLGAMVLWFAYELVWEGKVPLFRDLGPYFYPIRWSLAESLRAGELPLWDRHMAAGFPLLADFQSATFYPIHLVFLVMPFFPAISFIFLFHYLTAATGSYLLCRHWGYPSYLSMAGAVLFTFGGIVVSLTNLLNHFQTAVWLPWLALFAERYLYSCRWRDFLGFTLVLLLQFLAGSPELYIMSMALIVLGILMAKARSPELGSWKKIALVLLGGNALVLALAMVQIAPTIELFLHSRRTQAIPYSEAMDWSLNPADLLNFFFLDKEIDTTVSRGMRLFLSSRASFFISYYLGALSLFGVCFWALYSSTKERTITLALVVSTLVLAFGAYTPIYPFLLRSFPLLGLVRFPEKFLFLIYGILWFISLRGLFAFFEAEAHQQRRASVALLSIPLVFVLLYIVLRERTDLVSQFIHLRTNSALLSHPTIKSAAALLVSIERQVLLTLGIALLLFAVKKRRGRSILLRSLLVAVVFIDLERAHRDYQYLLDPGFIYEGPRVISHLENDPSRVFYYPAGETLHPFEYSVLALPSFEGAISLVFSNLLPNSGVIHGFDYFQEIDALSRRPYVSFLLFADRADPETRFRLLGTLNVKHLISFRPLPGLGITLVRHFPQYPSWLYRIDRVVPRVYVVPNTSVEKNPMKVLQRMSSPGFDPLKEIILEKPVSRPPAKDLRSEVSISEYANQHVVIRASLDNEGILVLTDSFYPGWRVYVDGEEQEILRANLFFRAVALSQGDHLVEFRYEPVSFKIGLAGTLVTFFGLLVFIIKRKYFGQSGRRFA